MPVLEINNVTKKFGGLMALDDVSFQVEEGEIRGLIGPNGAGKSTMFKNIAGFYSPSSGDIRYQGQSIAGRKPHDIAEMGVVRTFQETTLFQELSVFENVLVGCHIRSRSNLFAAILGLDRGLQREAEEKVAEVLDFMGLGERREQLASELPLGSQRALAIAIALASEPGIGHQHRAGRARHESGHGSLWLPDRAQFRPAAGRGYARGNSAQ
jgi:branched-chain amino acid transport system ATP-binding protein